jgi:bifunctional non-homologous end joining protein LigD
MSPRSVALGEDGWPDFPLICDRMLNGRSAIPVVYVIFDVLELDRRATTNLPYRDRRALLEEFALHDRHWQTSATFDDAEALWTVVEEHGLEGVVAKRLRSTYRPGERGWVKVKNRAYWRYELEREAAMKRPRRTALAIR